MTWHIFENGRSIGQTGSEVGIILRDEEHLDGSRITLEQGGTSAPFAITCGISGWMMHTRFFGSETEALSEFGAMKVALSEILAGIPMATDLEVDAKCKSTSRSIEMFVKRFP